MAKNQNVKAFFLFARMRHQIYLDRMAQKTAPWTADPVLSQYRFTNVFRELDRTTVWFRENIRGPLKMSAWVVPATVIFRWFNRIETGKIMLDSGILSEDTWDLQRFEDNLRAALPRGPWVTGSYMVFSGKNNGDKLDGLLILTRQFMDWWYTGGRQEFCGRPSLKRAYELLCQNNGLSGFTSYEVVTDLRWTSLVNPDGVMSWTHAGPGATRGMSRILYGHHEGLSQLNAADQATMTLEMRGLLARSRSAEHWPQLRADWPSWELRDVEHTLCEFDKYERIRREQGQTKRKFKPEEARPLPGSEEWR